MRPALQSYPSDEILGQPNRYGPMANFKISLRELPDQGNFRVTVKAARYDDALILDADESIQEVVEAVLVTVADLEPSLDATVVIREAGIYQVDVDCVPGKTQGLLSLTLGERHFAGQLFERESETPAEAQTENDGSTKESPSQNTAFMLVRLPAGPLNRSEYHAQSY